MKGKFLGRRISEETKKKMSRPAWNKGLKLDKESPLKGRVSPLKGKPITQLHRNNLSISLTGHKKATVSCPYCSLVGGRGNMFRYHFEKCKLFISDN